MCQWREHLVRLTTACAVMRLLPEPQLSLAAHLAWPFTPRIAQIAAAKLGWDGLAGGGGAAGASRRGAAA